MGFNSAFKGLTCTSVSMFDQPVAFTLA